MNPIIIIGMILIVAYVINIIYKFMSSPTEKQKEMIVTWLLVAVTEAEKQFGSGTGKLKLSKVYGWFIDKFPWLSQKMPIDNFNELVKTALDEMRHLLETNANIALYVQE